ncbi:MAG: type II toxin-antitoxin system HicA family toxin [Bacteroidales bacterium]|jgi:predicted RNA binding protein YcfA (HicA-like mRNA interferase family)|nr:type II toxin-antitoxin system HicA family toxin [Bacteroidales bacterium]
MNKLPILTGLEIIKALEKNGFIIIRQKGSHVFLRQKNDNRTTIVPIHKGKDIDRSLLSKILNDAGLSIEEFIKKNK